LTETDFQKARAAVLAGEDPSPELMAECRRSTRLLIRTRGLPAHYSLVGVWSDEAIEEAFADWAAVRLVERGQLKAILQRSPLLKVFRAACETSVRQHLIDRLKRSQSANLYGRVRRLLENDANFISTGSGSGTLWCLGAGPADPVRQGDHALLGHAWALGDFEVLRYDPDAKKLSPLLAAHELERFVNGMLQAGAMTVGTIVHAMELRFAIDTQHAPTQLDDAVAMHGGVDPQIALVRADLVAATLAELTERQTRVLLAKSSEVPIRDIARELSCSTGTVSHELRQIEEILARLGADAPDVLNKVLDELLKEET
jgi:hypothetical protein